MKTMIFEDSCTVSVFFRHVRQNLFEKNGMVMIQAQYVLLIAIHTV